MFIKHKNINLFIFMFLFFNQQKIRTEKKNNKIFNFKKIFFSTAVISFFGILAEIYDYKNKKITFLNVRLIVFY